MSNFTIQTRTQESTKGDDTYVEAYPDGQYFIDIKLIDPTAFHGLQKFEAHFLVDGKDLGYRKILSSKQVGETKRQGIGKEQDGSKQSLSFVLFNSDTENPLCLVASKIKKFEFPPIKQYCCSKGWEK